MILNRNLYVKSSFLNSLFIRWRIFRLRNERVFKEFRINRANLSTLRDFYSPKFKIIPEFSGNLEALRCWKDAKSCERICPTSAIKVTEDSFEIDVKSCIACGDCMKIAPEGIFKARTK